MVTISIGSTTRPTTGSDVSWHPCQKGEEGAFQDHCGLELSSSVYRDLSSVLVDWPVVHARFDIGFRRYSTRYILMMESLARSRTVTSGHERGVTSGNSKADARSACYTSVDSKESGHEPPCCRYNGYVSPKRLPVSTISVDVRHQR